MMVLARDATFNDLRWSRMALESDVLPVKENPVKPWTYI